jgi:aspartokinase-like uncharacterized kinase
VKAVKVNLLIRDGDEMEHVTSVTSDTTSLKFIVNLHGLKLVIILYFCINVNNNTINTVIIKQIYVLTQYVNSPS